MVRIEVLLRRDRAQATDHLLSNMSRRRRDKAMNSGASRIFKVRGRGSGLSIIAAIRPGRGVMTTTGRRETPLR